MLKYRHEVDGLRALAVVSVVLYHAKFQFNGITFFKNGFIGVDIFFVISGFLIGRIILTQAEDKSLSLLAFYSNRIRRILPVAFLILLLSSLLGWYTLLPSDFIRLQESILTSALFISNVFFQNISLEYGAQESLLNPLTHTWSLSIEEQFYIIIPFFILLIYKVNKAYLAKILIIFIFVSFLYACLTSFNTPISSFFQFKTRAWELAIGVLTAHINLKKKYFLSIFSQISLYLIGVFFLINAFIFDYNKNHPGLFTILPVLGTILIIHGSNHLTKLHIPFNNSITRYIGKISFSLYMWHYPIYSFYRIHNNEYTNFNMFNLTILTIILSMLTYEFYEQPMRRYLNSTTFKIALTFLLIPIFTIGLATVSIKDFEKPWRSYAPKHLTKNYDIIDDIFVASATSNEECHIKVNFQSVQINQTQLQICSKKFGDPIIIVGDSHAENIFNAMSYSGIFNFVISFAQPGCRPAICSEGLMSQFELLNKYLSNEIFYNGHIIFHQSGSYLIRDENGLLDSQLAFDSLRYEVAHAEIEKIKLYLTELSGRVGRKIAWLGPFVEYRNDPRKIVLQANQGKSFSNLMSINPNSIVIFADLEDTLTRLEFGESNIEYITFNQLYELNPSAEVFHSNNQRCFQFRDRDHFSYCGEIVMAKMANWSIFGID